MISGSIHRWSSDPPSDSICLASAAQIESYARMLDKYNPRLSNRHPRPPRRVPEEGSSVDGEDEEDEDEDEDDGSDSSEEGYVSADSVPSSPTPGPSRSSSPDPIPPVADSPLPRMLSLAIPPSELNSSFPTHALTRILAAFSSSLTHLSLSHTESLLAHDPSIPRTLASLTSLTHLALSALGPRACEL
ncbi:hypothetical protein FKP32DRAFT_1680314, partial [Trametes sanguinea]